MCMHSLLATSTIYNMSLFRVIAICLKGTRVKTFIFLVHLVHVQIENVFIGRLMKNGVLQVS